MPSDSYDPNRLRISDQDRHQVAEVLRQAAGDGRIDLEELDERLEATYAAKTYGELVPITADIPVGGHPVAAPASQRPTPVVAGGPDHERGVAILGGYDRKGVWTVPRELGVVCFMGGANLDLRQAQFAAREVVITANAVMGGVDITVNRSTRVVVEGVGVMGAFDGPKDRGDEQIDATSPTVRVKGFALMGGVSIRRKDMPRERRRRLRDR